LKILAIEREVPGTPADAFAPYLKAEAAHAWQLYQAGVVRELYFRQDEHSFTALRHVLRPSEERSLITRMPIWIGMCPLREDYYSPMDSSRSCASIWAFILPGNTKPSSKSSARRGALCIAAMSVNGLRRYATSG
jgi:hypothetical protein